MSRRWALILGGVFLLAVGVAVYAYRHDILLTELDPKIPFPVYRPPAAPDYAQADAWAVRPSDAQPPALAADVFFVHPTTYLGGGNWVDAVGDRRTEDALLSSALPNYAGPFRLVGRVFAPRYRQASLFSVMSPKRTDALEAEEFGYDDVRRAFGQYLAGNSGRPFILVGVEQGGVDAARLLRDEVAPHPDLLRRLVAVYLVETLVPAADYAEGAPVPACAAPDQSRCVLAYASVEGIDPRRLDRLGRSVVWTRRHLTPLNHRPTLCVNPLLGRQTDDPAAARLNRGAANASDLEWEARPALLPHQVSARCSNGLLWVSRPHSDVFHHEDWLTQGLFAPHYNLFYADLEADARRRLAAWLARSAASAPAG